MIGGATRPGGNHGGICFAGTLGCLHAFGAFGERPQLYLAGKGVVFASCPGKRMAGNRVGNPSRCCIDLKVQERTGCPVQFGVHTRFMRPWPSEGREKQTDQGRFAASHVLGFITETNA